MAVKAADIINAALLEIGEYASGETPTDADAQACLEVLNFLLDEWSNEPQACFCELTQTFTLVTNQTAYTIGPSVSADINGIRPLQIVQAIMLDPLGNRYPINIVPQFDWNRIVNLQINGQIPTTLFYDPQDPIGILNFWPSPLLNWDISIFTYSQLTAFPALYTDVILPRGYKAALTYALAKDIASLFGRQSLPSTLEKASRTLAAIKRTNFRQIIARYDQELVYGPNVAGQYNIRNDAMTGGLN